MVNNPLSKLWIGTCNVYEYQEVTDPETFQTKHDLVLVVKDEPCRLSFKTEGTASVYNGVAEVNQITVLFIRPDLEIKAGSVLEVTQHERTTKYKRSSEPAVYTGHQEVTVELYEEKA